MDAALSLDDVWLTLPAASGPVEILKGVSFRAMPGESVAVVGPSGSGKSSLIAVSTGIERASKGAIRLLGEELGGKSEDALARLRRGRVSLVFQSFHLLGTMNAFDNVRAPLEIAGLKDVDALAKSGLEAVGLGARMDHFPGQLSGGERQRVAVARALARLRRGRVSLVFQSFHLLGTMNAFDNVRAPLEIAGLKDVDALAKSGLEAVGLGARMDHFPGQLSGGERQRVAVARALASNPRIVFADEPTGNLDRMTGAMVADMLFAIARERDATLVVVTHDAEIAARADRVVEMRDGRVV